MKSILIEVTDSKCRWAFCQLKIGVNMIFNQVYSSRVKYEKYYKLEIKPFKKVF